VGRRDIGDSKSVPVPFWDFEHRGDIRDRPSVPVKVSFSGIIDFFSNRKS